MKIKTSKTLNKLYQEILDKNDDIDDVEDIHSLPETVFSDYLDDSKYDDFSFLKGVRVGLQLAKGKKLFQIANSVSSIYMLGDLNEIKQILENKLESE